MHLRHGTKRHRRSPMRTTVFALLAGLIAAVLVAVGCGGEEPFCYEENDEVVCVSADEDVGETTQAVATKPPAVPPKQPVEPIYCYDCHGLRTPAAKVRYDALAALGQLWH
jgi:hypothetical protein